jgi:hypothetical protein
MRYRNRNESDYIFGMDVALTIAILMTVLLLLAMSNKQQKDEENQSQEFGHMCAEISWDPTYDTDIDVWGKFEQDASVGWSNMHGEYMDLWRDDLGMYRDISPINYEILCTRGVRDGEHTFTVHYFADKRASALPVHVDATITFYPKVKDGKREIIHKKMEMSVIKQEKTIANFVVRDGKILPESINDMDVTIGPSDTMPYVPYSSGGGQ